MPRGDPHGTSGDRIQERSQPRDVEIFVEAFAIGLHDDRKIGKLPDDFEQINSAGVKLAREYDLAAPRGVNGRNSDNTRVRALLGWEPTTSLREGMRKTYEDIFKQMSSRVAFKA